MGVISVLAVVAAGSSLFFWQDAKRQATNAELGEKVTTIDNLLTTKPVERLVLAIQATGQSLSELNRVTAAVESSLLQVLQTDIRERNRLSSGWAAAISPDGATIVTGSSDGNLQLWDRQGQAIGKPFVGHTDSVQSVAFSPDGKSIVSGSRDNTLRLWNLQGQPIGKPLVGHTDSVFSVAFSPDGKSIVSGSRDKTLRLWNLQGQLMSILQGHENTIFSVAFSSNGRYIVSGSQDNTLRLWDRELKVEQLLKIACNQLQEHPVLVKDKGAGDTCLKWGGWNDREKKEFQARRDRA
ncbi:hypothetical protein B7486_18785 [cyanobacterium TDX16]|nr:hypothetical protein B7486_18785 [cyanobacterium TDX16]